MDAALLIARLLLAGVFALAGVAKLSDLEGSRKAIIDFGLPVVLASPLALLLPLAELAVAAALIPASTAWWGALGALGLLVLFVVGISINLARGRKPDCHCFGQLHSAPAGWKTLARNGVLAAVAGFVLWEGYDVAGPSAISWLGAISTAQLLTLLGGVLVLSLLAGQWWFLAHLLRQNGRLLVRLEAVEESVAVGGGLAPSQNGTALHQAEGLPVGSEAPEFGLSGLHGETLTLEALRASGKPVLLFFTDPGCGPCNAMLPDVGRWQQEHAQKLTLALVSRGDVEENKIKASEHGLKSVLVQKDWEVSESYDVRGTPSAVLIAPEGKIASPVAGGAEGIRGLLSHAVGRHAQLPMQPQQRQAQGQPCPDCGKVHAAAPTVPAAQKVGEEAPEVKLPDLEGNTVELADFGGEETLVLFWNPGCGFCRQMLPDLKQWESEAPESAPKIVVVSAGSEEANRGMGLASAVLLDQQFAAGRAFGASGTPSAVLVDAEGKVASEVAVGAPAVMELAGADKTTT
ncbi:MAG TPA: TlpA disulfide reductase family protein [Rubrobacter sp.]|nr:TlpA disulfide reductase family protein [Rubrobacter sp.]